MVYLKKRLTLLSVSTLLYYSTMDVKCGTLNKSSCLSLEMLVIVVHFFVSCFMFKKNNVYFLEPAEINILKTAFGQRK